MKRLGDGQLDLTQSLLAPALRELTRCSRLIRFAKDTDRHRFAPTAVQERIRHESRLGGDQIGELVLDEPDELVRWRLVHEIAPDAREHVLALLSRPDTGDQLIQPPAHPPRTKPTNGRSRRGSRAATPLSTRGPSPLRSSRPRQRSGARPRCADSHASHFARGSSAASRLLTASPSGPPVVVPLLFATGGLARLHVPGVSTHGRLRSCCRMGRPAKRQTLVGSPSRND